jgi:predicted metal-dependent peptidase
VTTNTPARIDATLFAAARLRAVAAQPFLATALFALTPVPRPGLGTFAVDQRWRLYIDPDVLIAWGSELAAGVLLHEVGHVVRDHAARAREAFVDESSAHRWNVAADAEINDSLIRDRVALPATPITSALLRLPPHRVAEFYFEQLAGRNLPDCSCGSGAHGQTEAIEVEPGVLGAGLNAARAPGIDDIEADLIRRQVAIAIRSAIGQQPGSVGADWERWANATLDPVVPWAKLLRAAIRSGVAAVAGRADYSYSRPARRRFPPVVLPALVQPLPQVAIVVDTSGSMTQDALDRAWSEVIGCLRSLGVRRELLRVYAVDTGVHSIKQLSAIGSLRGGGGTDMGEGIRAALRAAPRPDLVVVLTDGYTPWPNRAPASVTVVCAIIGSRLGISRPPVPEWATRIDIDIDIGADPATG